MPKQLNLSPQPDWRTLSLQHAHITPVIRPLHPPEHHLHSLASHERVERKTKGKRGCKRRVVWRESERDNKSLSAVQFVLVLSIGFRLMM